MNPLPSRNNDGASAGIADRLPPHNIEAEKSLLGACLLDDRMVDECVDTVRASDFYRADHGTLWACMVEIRDAGHAMDPTTLAEALIRRDLFHKVGGDELLRELCEFVPHAANASYYAGIIRELATARELLEGCTETIREVYARQHTASDLVCNAEERIFAVGERDSGVAWEAADAIGEAMVRLDMRRRGKVADGLATGLKDLDLMTGGLQPGAMAILAARPSQGKTALACDVMRHVAGAGQPVLLISLEMGRQELANRLLASHAQVDGFKIRDAQYLCDRDHQALYRAAGELSDMTFRIDDTAGKTVSQIAAQARRTKRRRGLSLLVIDYLGLIDGRRQKGESRQEEVARISRGIKTLARSLHIPVLALHQLNRRSEDREGRRPRMADLRESGQIEADADLVLLLHRPEFYDANDQPGTAELFVEKNRNGATGTIRLSFRKEWTRFDDLALAVDPISEGQPF